MEKNSNGNALGPRWLSFQSLPNKTSLQRRHWEIQEAFEGEKLSYICYSCVSEAGCSSLGPLRNTSIYLLQCLPFPCRVIDILPTHVSSNFVMTAIPDDVLFTYADRVKDKVAIITG